MLVILAISPLASGQMVRNIFLCTFWCGIGMKILSVTQYLRCRRYFYMDSRRLAPATLLVFFARTARANCVSARPRLGAGDIVPALVKTKEARAFMNGLCFSAAKIDKAGDKLNKSLLRVTPCLLTDNCKAKPFGICKTTANGINPLLCMAIRVPGSNQIVGVVLNISAKARAHQMAGGRSMLRAIDKGGAACAILQSAATRAQFRQNNSCVCWPVFPTMAVIKGGIYRICYP